MGIFNSIKKSRRASSDIDEKIEYLDKELEKNGLREGMTTSNVYVSGNRVDNPIYSSFTSSVFNARPLGHSPSDNSGGLGGAYTGKVIAGEHGLSVGVHDSILNLKGVANSPKHPVSGKRRYASTRTGMVSYSPTQPGVKQGNSQYPTGSVAWLWNPTQNNSDGTTGNWYPLEFDVGSGQWGFWDTNFLGFGFLNTNLSQLEFSSGDSTGASVVSLFNTIGITNRENIGTEKTIVLQKNDLGSAGFLPININLSTQGYNYLKGRAKRGTGFINYRGNQKQKLDKPPTKSRAEIRGDAVNKLRGEGDNVGANIFYTKDRIKELEGKESLTYREESELKGLEEYNDWISSFDTPENKVSVADRQKTFDTQAVEENQSFNNQFQNNSNQIASEIATYVEKTPNLSAEEKKAFTEIANDIRNGENINNVISNNLLSSSSSTPQTTPEPPSGGATNVEKGAHEFPDGTTGSQTSFTDQNGDTQRLYYNDKGEAVDASGRTPQEAAKLADKGKDGNNAAVGVGVVTGSVAKHTPSEEEISQYIANITPDMIASGEIQVNSQRVPYTDGNFQITYDSNGNRVFTSNRDADGNQGANFPDMSFDSNNSSSMTNYGKPIQQVVYPSDGSEPYLLFEKYSYHNKQSTDKSEIPDPWSQFGSDAAHFLGKVFEPINEFLFRGAFGAGNKVPQHVKDMGIHGMAHTEQKIPLSELSDDFREALEQTDEYNEWNDANNDKDAAEKYPPPGQSGEYTTPDGGKVKYYNKGIKTSADGSKYMEVLTMPWIEPKEGVHDGYYGSLHHPGSYTMKVPLGGAQLRFKGMGKEVFTPEPKPEPKPEPDDRKDYEKNRDRQRRLRRSSYEPKGNVLSEAAKLGHFEPEVLNVDINDIRKGIMPEFPKDPPPEMVDGYSEKSKLAPKKDEGDPDPFIKITKKDLAKNHMLKDSEIKKFMDEIDSINKYIKENPSELIYAQQRYPKDDPRLAQLNWQMDQMLDASKEYMDKHYPENEKLFKKIQKSIKKNIELTDPKSFKGVEIPKFKGVNLIDYKRRKEVVTRHFKKAVKIERLFSNKKRRNYIKEEREYLNDESNNTLKEFMTTSGMYFAAKENPAIPAVTAPVPDSTGVLGSGFTPPIGGNGNANDPSNYPAAYDTSWMYNSDDVDGETNRPIVKTIDQSVIDAFNTAFPDSSRFPSGGAGIVFGPRGFGTGVGYASGGHYIGVLSPGLFGNGSTKIVPPGSPFGAPWFGMGGMYFPATPELAEVIMAMSGAYADAGGYNPQGALPIQLWAPHSTFHDGQWDDQGTQKYIDNNNNRWVLRTFYLHQVGNDYIKEPAVPPTSTVLYRNDLGNPNFLPINIDLGDLSNQGFQYLSDKASPVAGAYSGMYDIDGRGWFVTGEQLLKMQKNPEKFNLTPAETRRIRRMQVSIPDGTKFASTDLSSLFPPSEPDKFPVDPPPEVPDEPPAPPEPDPDPDSDEKKDPAGLDATAIKFGYNDPYTPVNPDGHYIALVTSAQSALDAEMNYAFYSAAANGESPNYNTAAINKAKETLRKYREKLDNWERWKKENNYVWKGSIDSSAEADRRKDVLDKDKQIDNELEKLKKDQAQAEADAEMYAAEAQKLIAQFGIDVALTLFGGKILSLAGKAVGKIPAVAKFFKLSKAAQKAQIDDALKGQSSKIPNIFKNAKNLSADDVLDQFQNIDQSLYKLFQRNAPLSTSVQGGQTVVKSRTGDILRIYDRKLNKFVKPPEFQLFSHELDKEKLLSEAAKLGHFEPEQLNVNIEDLRKGIMPEFPEEAPPELINGYSSKSRLAPKKLERSSFIKITKKDLAKNHKLKDSEIKDFMNKINAVNDFIKKHPEELVYAQTRYPKSDPRLAQLNWEMDQKLNASKQFMDKHYPENQRLFTKIQKSINKNIELTDPKSFKGVKTPKFKGVDLTDYKRRKAVVSRHFKKAIRNNKK